MQDKIKTIAVIGSNSFTGSHLINHILNSTDFKILAISRSPEYSSLFLPYKNNVKKSERVKFHQINLNDINDFNDLSNLFEREKPEIVFNYAAQGEVRNSWKYPYQWFNTNCLAVVKLADYLKDKEYLKRYVAISTPEVYGSSSKKSPEKNEYNPSTPYASSKLSGDLFLHTLYKRYKFPVIFVRSTNVYGEHQQLYRIIPRSVIYLKSGRKIKLHGGGKAQRTFINVEDVVNATWQLSQKGKDGEVYHVSDTMKPISIFQLFKKICKMLDKNPKDYVEFIEQDFGQDKTYFLDSSKTYKLLKWKPKISLDEGLKKFIVWMQHNWEDIRTQELNYIHKE